MAIDGPSRDNVELGKHGRSRTNGAMQALTPSVPTARRSLPRQPTVKPVVAIADAIRDVTKRNDLVLYPFSGSETTLIAAKKTGKRARAVEIDGGDNTTAQVIRVRSVEQVGMYRGRPYRLP